MSVICLPRAVKLDDNSHGAVWSFSRSGSASVLAFALCLRGLCSGLDLIAEGAFRLWGGLDMLRFSDFTTASFLTLSHARMSFP